MSKDIAFCNGEIEAKLSDDIIHIVDCPLKDICYRNYNLPTIGWYISPTYDFSLSHCPNYWRKKK